MGKKPITPIQKYMETATPEEQEELSRSLLASQARIERTSRISERTIRASRLLSSAIILAYLSSSTWNEDLIKSVGFFFLLGAIAWFPNEVAAATGRIGIRPAVSRPSHPWFLFIAAWLFLLPLGFFAILQWVRFA